MEREPYRPSNGTEGSMFQKWNCYGCVRDHTFHEGSDEGGCEILLRSMRGDLVPEWTRTPESGWPGDARCSEWDGPCQCVIDLDEQRDGAPTVARFRKMHRES